jgi:hypothetical protein
MAVTESLSMRTLFKFILPSMGGFMTLVLLWGNNQKVWAVLPTLLIATYLGAADIRMEGKHIYYRHFFSWQKLPHDVSDVRCSLLPALGYIRFRHFSPPFGILFFIVERGSERFVPFRRTALMQSMVSPSHLRKVELNLPIDTDPETDKANRKALFAQAFFPAAGILAGVLVPVPWQHWTSPVNQTLLSRFLQIQHNPAVLGLYVVVLVALTIRNRSHGATSFGLAFLIGTIVAHLAHVR